VPSGSSAFFLQGTSVFSVKLVDAQFPPYQQVIPTTADRTMRVSRTALNDAVRAVSIAAAERTGGIRFSLMKGKVLLTSESPESGDGTDEVTAEYNGAPMSLGVNARYVLEVLGALSCEEVTLDFNGELEPMVVKPVSSEGPSYVGVVMPMRI
jgi:DNA polymerase-3 subunit beta